MVIEVYIEKPRRIRSTKTIERMKKEYCEYCYRYTRLDGQNIGHVHHIKSKGSGGDDIESNLIYLCYECHDKVHKGLIEKETLKEIVVRR